MDPFKNLFVEIDKKHIKEQRELKDKQFNERMELFYIYLDNTFNCVKEFKEFEPYEYAIITNINKLELWNTNVLHIRFAEINGDDFEEAVIFNNIKHNDEFDVIEISSIDKFDYSQKVIIEATNYKCDNSYNFEYNNIIYIYIKRVNSECLLFTYTDTDYIGIISNELYEEFKSKMIKICDNLSTVNKDI